MNSKINSENPVSKGVTYKLTPEEFKLINIYARFKNNTLAQLLEKYPKPETMTYAQWEVWLSQFI